MSVLSDNEINKRLGDIFPHTNIPVGNIQPSSVDLRLGLDLKTINGDTYYIYDDGSYVLQPNEFILASTLEWVEMPVDLVGIVNGKSTLGRLGLMVHITAGYIDPNFKGNITLELYNVSDEPIELKPYEPICQIIFEELTSVPSRLYGDERLGSQYQKSSGTVISGWKEAWQKK